MWAPQPVWKSGEDKILFLCQDSNPNLPACSLDPTMNTLFRLLLFFYYFNKFNVGCIYKIILVSQQLTESDRSSGFHYALNHTNDCLSLYRNFQQSSPLLKCSDSSLKFVCVVYILWFVSCTVSKQTGNISREAKLHELSCNS